MYIVLRIAQWIASSFLAAVIIGSISWFIGSMFGYEWDYFSYIRGWFIIALIIDALMIMYQFGTGE